MTKGGWGKWKEVKGREGKGRRVKGIERDSILGQRTQSGPKKGSNGEMKLCWSNGGWSKETDKWRSAEEAFRALNTLFMGQEEHRKLSALKAMNSSPRARKRKEKIKKKHKGGKEFHPILMLPGPWCSHTESSLQVNYSTLMHLKSQNSPASQAMHLNKAWAACRGQGTQRTYPWAETWNHTPAARAQGDYTETTLKESNWGLIVAYMIYVLHIWFWIRPFVEKYCPHDWFLKGGL